MTENEQETWLSTIRARLERLEDGRVIAINDPNGDFIICERTEGKLIKYFQPTWAGDIDPYGNVTPKTKDGI